MRRVAAALVLVSALAASGGADPGNRPETWFHLIGGNVSQEGLTADLEAIREAGIGGIQLFHGQVGKASAWPGVRRQIPCLSEDWDAMIVHVARECRRLGLTFKMQNCPGWSMSGGPWIRPENAMRNLCCSRTRVRRGAKGRLARPTKATDRKDRDYRDLFVLAFPTPLGDEGEWLRPDREERIATNVIRFAFGSPVTVRTVELPSVSFLDSKRAYDPEMTVVLYAEDGSGCGRKVIDEALPPGNWQDGRTDGMRYTLAADEHTARTWRLEVHASEPVRLQDVRMSSAARLEHWEGLAGWTLRGLADRPAPVQDRRCWIDPTSLIDLTGRMDADGGLSWEPPDDREWSVLRIGHVNALFRNAPAPAEATGWECSKLSAKGIEANYAAYIGRLAKGPVRGGLQGMVVDSWECFRDNWTDGLDVLFRQEFGYDLVRRMPALFGWVIGTPSETADFLRDWRGFIGRQIERNYYGRMAELAHADGLSVQFETAFGDVLAGDLLEFWKHADVPMCEFWRPTAPTGVGSANFKPVLPCASAAHIYGKRRVAAEALTNCALDWNEALRDFKPVIDRHFAKGVTHIVFHTYTHNPQVGFLPPGTSFGSRIGTPFLRGQSWWPFMRGFTDYCARCTEFLERGHAVVDVLRVLGDGLGHKPDESRPHFGNRFKDDYINRDALLNRLDVVDGRLRLPDGMGYSVLWIPDGTFLGEDSRRRIDALAAKGAKVIRGGDPTDGLCPDVESDGDSLVWYHRRDGSSDLYFVAAVDAPYDGDVRFRGRKVSLVLEQGESRFVTFDGSGREPQVLDPVTGRGPIASRTGRVTVLGGFVRGCDQAEFRFDGRKGIRTVLDLGKVEQCAELVINGRPGPRLWCPPYRADITGFIEDGENAVSVRITSTWYNRLVEDAGRPESERRTWTLWGPDAGSPLKPAGLYGPVRLTAEDDARHRAEIPEDQCSASFREARVGEPAPVLERTRGRLP